MVAKSTDEIRIIDASLLDAARESMGDKGSDYSDAELQAVATYFASIFSAVSEGVPPYMPKHMLGLYFANVFVHSFMAEAIVRGVINVKNANDIVNETLDKLRIGSVESARETLFGKGPHEADLGRVN
jgi:hypothetical protein